MRTGPKPKDIRERLLAKIEPEPMSGCWLWTGYLMPNGYGMVGVGGASGSMKLAHRVAYETLGGARIPDGLTLDHLCRVRSCVNPSHLEPVTLRTNLLRGNTTCAAHARKTACPRGHALTQGNLDAALLKRGMRSCRICKNRTQREYNARRAARQKGIQ